MNSETGMSRVVLTAGSLLTFATALPASAEQESVPIARIDVTGSNIKRTEIETALPVQIITREEIERSGATTSAEVLSHVSANLIGATDALSIGSQNPGLSSANLRGLGDGSTLVLINGRRAANYAFNGGAVDLNSIPLAAVERIEILKDGASAIYGTDAMAGVINFILRRDFSGVQVTAYAGDTEHGGANHLQATVSVGFGNLATDRFNVFLTADWQKDQALRASERAFARTGYLPDEGIGRLSSQTFPANIRAGNALLNPTRANGCAPPSSIPSGPTSPACAFDFAAVVDILPPVERTGVVAGATVALDADNRLFAQYIYARNDFTLTLAPTPASERATFNGVPVLYPAGGPFYPTAFVAANGISGDLNLFYRTVALGPRTNEVESTAQHAVAGAEGIVAGWDYNAAFIYSENTQKDTLGPGWVLEQRLLAAMASGLVNPFGASGAAGDALLVSTQITGEIRNAKGTTQSFDAKVSREVHDLPAGPVALALGIEARRETFSDTVDTALGSGDILSFGQVGSRSASRTVQALFAELNVPVARNVEAQLAARYDHYSDFGGTTNPKVAVRWQPTKSLLLRTSWGTGFRAPTLYDLATPLTQGFTGLPLSDPLRCPTTGLDTDCDTFFKLRNGGNPTLQPERSQQFNAGVLWAPVAGLSLGADYWNINKTGTIGQLASGTIIGNIDRFGASNVVRGPVDPGYPDLPGPIDYILGWQQNLGNLRTSGIDVDMTCRGPATSAGRFTFNLNGTYVIDWQEQLDGVNYVSGVGRNADPFAIGAVPRWRHYAALNWTLGPWGATLAQTFSSGYTDVNPDPAGNPRKVGSYDIWDLQATYGGFRNTTLVLGIKNLFDRAPPFSNQAEFMQTGYNPQYGDPRGRIFYGSLTLAFK